MEQERRETKEKDTTTPHICQCDENNNNDEQKNNATQTTKWCNKEIAK